MKRTLYQKQNKKLSIALFIVLMPLMALKGGSQTPDSNARERIANRRANEIVRDQVDKINDTIRFIDAWQRYKDSVDAMRSKEDNESSNKK